MSDWRVGDLAAQPYDAPYCARCEAEAALDLPCDNAEDGILTVVAVYPPNFGETECGLRFASDPPSEKPWCACQFRKIVADQHEACETEFVTLLKRSKQRVVA